jgi:membrane protease YdiL (CAAX protease family)
MLLGCYPFITLITGYKFILPDNWLWLAIGVFAIHGVAEETLYRGFLFRHLRENNSFIKAAGTSVLFFTAAHIPIIVNQGLIIGGSAAFWQLPLHFHLHICLKKEIIPFGDRQLFTSP